MSSAKAVLDQLHRRLMAKGSWRRGWQVLDVISDLERLREDWESQRTTAAAPAEGGRDEAAA